MESNSYKQSEIIPVRQARPGPSFHSKIATLRYRYRTCRPPNHPAMLGANSFSKQQEGTKTRLLKPTGSDKGKKRKVPKRGTQKNERGLELRPTKETKKASKPTGGSTPSPPPPNQAHSHSANTHHLALRSARTRPRHVPFSPILITVSHAVVNPTSVSSTARFPYSCFLVSRMIF